MSIVENCFDLYACFFFSETKCVMQRDAVSSQTNLFDQFVPECDKNGLFNSKQCYGFLNECWCVNKTTGTEMEFSRGPMLEPYNIDCDKYHGRIHAIIFEIIQIIQPRNCL